MATITLEPNDNSIAYVSSYEEKQVSPAAIAEFDGKTHEGFFQELTATLCRQVPGICTLPPMFYGECLALTSALLWGSIPILVRKGLPHANASVAVVIGLLASLPLLCGVFLFHPRTVTEVVAPQAALWFAAVGITGPCLGRLFNYIGVARLGAARATPLINSSPLLTTLLAILFLREQITFKILLGGICMVAGIIVLARQRAA